MRHPPTSRDSRSRTTSQILPCVGHHLNGVAIAIGARPDEQVEEAVTAYDAVFSRLTHATMVIRVELTPPPQTATNY